jgi:hypothetical protein
MKGPDVRISGYQLTDYANFAGVTLFDQRKSFFEQQPLADATSSAKHAIDRTDSGWCQPSDQPGCGETDCHRCRRTTRKRPKASGCF